MKYSLRYKLIGLAKQLGQNFDPSKDEAVREMQSTINALGSGINFKIEQYSDGSWMAKALNVDGLITGSRDTREIDSMIKDAVFTYFGISPQYTVDSLLRGSGEAVVTEQNVRVTA